jgi:hypothetical protein
MASADAIEAVPRKPISRTVTPPDWGLPRARTYAFGRGLSMTIAKPFRKEIFDEQQADAKHELDFRLESGR